MAEVDIPLNGRVYRIHCADGQEAHVGALGRSIDGKIAGLVKSIDTPVDVRLLLIASLMIADELSEAKTLATAAVSRNPAPPPPDAALVARVAALTLRVEAIASALAEDYV